MNFEVNKNLKTYLKLSLGVHSKTNLKTNLEVTSADRPGLCVDPGSCASLGEVYLLPHPRTAREHVSRGVSSPQIRTKTNIRTCKNGPLTREPREQPSQNPNHGGMAKSREKNADPSGLRVDPFYTPRTRKCPRGYPKGTQEHQKGTKEHHRAPKRHARAPRGHARAAKRRPRVPKRPPKRYPRARRRHPRASKSGQEEDHGRPRANRLEKQPKNTKYGSRFRRF